VFRYRLGEYLEIAIPVALGVVIGSGVVHYLHW